MTETNIETSDMKSKFTHGNKWVRVDFHLHTNADKEFKFNGDQNWYDTEYVNALKKAEIGLGVITNHNKFDQNEFKRLRSLAKKHEIGLLPGVELSVGDGKNGIHTLIVFSDDWLDGQKNYIQQFLSSTFEGKVPEEYENENGKTNDNLISTLDKLEKYDKDFFIVFAHVEAPSGLWNEVDGGRMIDFAKKTLIRRYCRGFQKVRTHNKPEKVNREKVKNWWKDVYPAEVEGSDPKSIDEIGKGRCSYLKIGELSFEAVKHALKEHEMRVALNNCPIVKHSHVNAIRFEGGIYDGKRVDLSPNLNCLIGIRGSGKSSILECLRFALDIPHGDETQDIDYKKELIRYVLKDGGKIIVELTDSLGYKYEVNRIYDQSPDYLSGGSKIDISNISTVIKKPLYFGQKDLSAHGDKFGQDLVEKLIGDNLSEVREEIEKCKTKLKDEISNYMNIQDDADHIIQYESDLKDVNFKLKQLDEHGVKEKLDKEIDFNHDISFCNSIEKSVKKWLSDLESLMEGAEESVVNIQSYESKFDKCLVTQYNQILGKLNQSVENVKKEIDTIQAIINKISELNESIETKKGEHKEVFAKITRNIVNVLKEQNITTINPHEYITLSEKKEELENNIRELKIRIAKKSQKYKDILLECENLNKFWNKEYKLIMDCLNETNKVQSELQINAVVKGDKESFRDKMIEIFSGSKIRKTTFETLSENYIDFYDVFKDLENAKNHAKGSSDVFYKHFCNNLAELLTYQVPYSFKISYHNRPLESHSLGQRASAMMLFLLNQEDNELLLIDQPEDDLDSQTIYKEVIKNITELKNERQFIFATHNANFPVLGDAEMVVSCSEEDKTYKVCGSSIDSKECQKLIIDIMEGGTEAFELRKSIYQYWKRPTKKS